MSDVMAMLHNEMVKRPPLTGPEMRKILAGGRSVAYHGRSGDRFITSPDQIPSVDILVADGYMDPVIAESELDAKIAELDALRANLEAQKALKIKAFNEQRKASADPYKDDMSDVLVPKSQLLSLENKINGRRRGRPPRAAATPSGPDKSVGFVEAEPTTD